MLPHACTPQCAEDDATCKARQLRELGYSPASIPALIEELQAMDRLKALGHEIAEIATPIKHWGGEHEYDGAMDVVWAGLHEALGIDHTDCSLFIPRRGCPLAQHRTSARPAPKTVRRHISSAKRLRVYKRDGYQCVTCGASEDLTLDHKVALVNGGTDDESNLQTMCRTHNLEKGTK